ncbi:SH3 domain-containing protein [Altericroceibacterium xinjiangense]|uniref:SH3 domain-containing protein n=1 Tax=Altericroceibacterium xinjiangense TaxID=762261 RepID=UPI000F7E503A|nr:SH3 domain-containing protein [Altericroceibacterium xinjiangense]
MRGRGRSLLLSAILLLVAAPAAAQEREVPYWASLRAEEVNMRVGPSEDFPIAWVYQREGLPVKVVRLMEGWRLVEDPEGEKGWMVARLLSPDRTALVVGEGLAPIRGAPGAAAPLRWNAEPGVVGQLGECEAGWCEIDVDGRTGWVEQRRLWGAGDP